MAEHDTDRRELVVFRIRSRDSRCSECGEEIFKGGFLRKDGERGLCLECADLGHLVFLPSGDPAVTRRASKYSPMRAVVVEWSRTRKRYERQGILVTPEAVEKAEEESLADAELRERRQMRAAGRREQIDAAYVKEFARRIRARYPAAPEGLETAIAAHACRKYSGRVGRSAAAKELDPEMIDLAVRAHIRHTETDYDELLNAGYDRTDARAAVRKTVDAKAGAWRGSDRKLPGDPG
jgi:hypothetical protein